MKDGRKNGKKAGGRKEGGRTEGRSKEGRIHGRTERRKVGRKDWREDTGIGSLIPGYSHQSTSSYKGTSPGMICVVLLSKQTKHTSFPGMCLL